MKKIIFTGLACISIGLVIGFQFTEKEITKGHIEKAAALFDLEFTEAEIDSMYDGVKENQADFHEMHTEYSVDNSVAPALQFNPWPQDYKPPTGNTQPRFIIPTDIEMPDNMDDLAFYTVSELAGLLRGGKISSVNLTKFFLDRLKKFDNQLHCVITLTEERALKQAAQADREIQNGQFRSVLHGIPYGAKDLLAVSGYKTTWGAMPYKDQVIDMDATVIQNLDAAGAVLIAKLTLGALAWGDVWYGEKTRNPWKPTTGSSGSSAGSASAVSAGLVPFALGTETLGSIVSPSTVCGTTGLRPTYGQVSRHGAMALSWSMDKIGPICRSAEDCAMVFDVIRGSDQKDKSAIDVPFDYASDMDIKGLRVGYLKSMEDGNYGFKSNDSLALEKLRNAGVTLVPIELPDYPPIGFILTAEAAAAFDELTRSNQDDLLVRQIKNAWPNAFRTARMVPAVEYIQANRLRSKLIEDMHDLMQDVDIYLNPSWSSSSLRITNMTGHPCVVVPNGFRNETPTSMTITGQLYGEADILAFAKMYQEITGHDEAHPEGF